MMRVLVCGGGNMGHAIAGMLAAKGFYVHVLTRQPERWSQTLTVHYLDSIMHGTIQEATNVVPKQVFDAVVISCPLTAAGNILRQLKRELSGTPPLVCVPGRLFRTYAQHEGMLTYPMIYVSRVPYICRIQQYGSSVHITGIAHNGLKFATRNNAPSQLLQRLFDQPASKVESVLSIDLSNSNSLLHPARLYDIFADGPAALHALPFYAHWTDNASHLLVNADAELQHIIRSLNCKYHSNIYVKPILEHYECKNASELTTKISTIPSLQSIMTPMTKDKTLDQHNRYFTEDVLLGLHFIKQHGQQMHVHTPTIDKIYYGLLGLTNM